jgi:hypothetical protein
MTGRSIFARMGVPMSSYLGLCLARGLEDGNAHKGEELLAFFCMDLCHPRRPLGHLFSVQDSGCRV